MYVTVHICDHDIDINSAILRVTFTFCITGRAVENDCCFRAFFDPACLKIQ